MMCVNASVPVLPAQLDFVHISSVLKNRPFFGQPEGVPGCAPNTHAFGCWHRPQLEPVPTWMVTSQLKFGLWKIVDRINV